MKKIIMVERTEKSFTEVFQEFVISQTAKGVSDTTLTNYHYHMRNIAKYLDTEQTFDDITKKDIEAMAAAMRKKGISHNSIAIYMRMRN